MKIIVRITKELYQESMYSTVNDSGTYGDLNNKGRTCATALSLRSAFDDLNPSVGDYTVLFDPAIPGSKMYVSKLPTKAREMIKLFEMTKPEEKVLLPEYSFAMDFPNELIEFIGMPKFMQAISTSETIYIGEEELTIFDQDRIKASALSIFPDNELARVHYTSGASDECRYSYDLIEEAGYVVIDKEYVIYKLEEKLKEDTKSSENKISFLLKRIDEHKIQIQSLQREFERLHSLKNELLQ